MFTKEKIFNFPFILLLVLTGINLILLKLPLTNVLHFEFSAINAILQSLFGGFLAIYFIKKDSSNKDVQFNIFTSHYKFLFIFTFSQFIIAFISNALFQICPLSEGLLFYFIITLPAFFIGIVLGLFSFTFSRKFAYITFIMVWIIILTAPLIELYSNPQIYFYNTIFGYFPGTIYDEDIEITSALISYRILNLIFFGILFFTLINKDFLKIRFARIYRALFIIITAVSFSLLKPNLGFSSNLSVVQNELNGVIETENFIIIFPDSLNKLQIENLVLNHEYFYSELKNKIEDEPDSKIISFVFENSKQKGKLFGANKADVAKPWLTQIYISFPNFESNLQHELAHIFSAKYGTTFLEIADKFNPVLIEGFATAFANNFADNDIHYMAKLASESGYKISIKSIFDGFNFFGQTSSISYIYAGSFTRYLGEVYGVNKIKTLYGNLDFQKIFHKKLVQLENEYFEFLNKKNFEINKSTADLYFGSKPIFKRFCARYEASQIKKGFEFYQKERYLESEQVFSEIYNVSESYQSLVGKTNSLIELKKENEALSFLKNEIKKFDRSSYFFNLEFLLGSLFIYNNDLKSADSTYTKLLEHSPSESYSNAALFRKMFLNESDSHSLHYLKSDADEKLKVVELLLDKYKIYEIIPVYLGLSENIDYEVKKEYLLNFYEQNNSANSLFEISLLAEKNNDFEFAKDCIKKAISQVLSVNKKIIYADYLKKYNWLINNRNEILSSLSFKNNLKK